MPIFLPQVVGIRALLLMGGQGERFESTVPKQFHRLNGKKVYLHTLETLLASELFEEILLVAPREWIQSIEQDVTGYRGVRIVEGGATRQESSFQGLKQCPKETRIVLIHDAVRPFVSLEILRENVAKALEFHAVDTCIPSADTLVFAPAGSVIQSIPNRAEYLRGQTPQSFSYPLIVQAHREGVHTQSTDDCSLVLRLGHPIHVVKGSEDNLKITTALDLSLAENLFKLRCHTLTDQKGSLKGKTIAVTGGTGGIGQALIALLEKEGARALSLARSSAHHPVDLTHFESTRALFETIGPLDGLINSIGYLKTAPFDALSLEEIDAQVACNLTAVLYSCKCAQMKEGGHIINIASSSHIKGRENYAVYSSAKAGLINFTQGLAEERKDLYINALVPGRTRSPMRLNNFPDEAGSELLDPLLVAQEAIKLLKQRTLTGALIEVRAPSCRL